MTKETTTTNAGTYNLIQRYQLGSAQSSITFSNLGNYRHLRLISSTRSTYATGTVDYMWMYFNGDTTAANYGRTVMVGEGSGSGGSAHFANQIINTMPAANAASNIYSGSVLDIADYKSTDKFKSSMETMSYSLTVTGLDVHTWKNTNAITSITLTPYFGPNFDANSTFTLYGIGVAR